jgi:branched-chain amino acid transport system substrate-binding protein
MYVIRTVAAISTLILFCITTVDAREYLVGVQLPLSGAYARTGKSMLEGFTTAMEEFNKHNPKHKIKLVVIDDESTVSKAISAAEKLASQGVVGIIGGMSTKLIAPAADIASKEGIAYITVGSTQKEMLDQGFKTFFRLNNNDGYNKPVADLIIGLGAKKVSMLTVTTQGNIDGGILVMNRLKEKGIKVVEHRFEGGVADFKPLINKVKIQDQPDVLLMNCLESDNINILRAAKVVKPNVKAVIGMYSVATAKMATEFPDLVQNVYGTTMLSLPPEFKTAEGKAFERTFKKLYNNEPDYLNQLSFVQGQVMYEAIKRTADKGGVTRGAVVSELRKTNRDTLIGRVAFNEKGDNPNFHTAIGQHQQGKRIPLVWPKEVATGKMNYPASPW